MPRRTYRRSARRESPSAAPRRHGCIAQPRYRVVGESNRGIRLEVLSEIAQQRVIEAGLHVDALSRRSATQLPFLDDERSRLEHVARGGEHLREVGIAPVNRDVRIRADAEMPLLLQAELPCRPRARDDRDLVERV